MGQATTHRHQPVSWSDPDRQGDHAHSQVEGAGGKVGNAQSCPELSRLPISVGNHQPRCLALLPIRSELSGCRRPLGPTEHYGHLRDDPPMVPDVRLGLCSPAPAPARRLGDTWHLDELFVAINGRKQYLWRAVDEDGDVLDILVQSRRNRRAAVRFFRKLLKEARVSSPSARHRHAAQLPGGPSNRDAIGSPSDRAVCEQPSRGVASTDAAARAPNATLQVSRPSAAVRGRPRRGAQSLPGRPTPASINSPPLASPPSVRRVGGGDVCLLTDGEDICNRGTRLSSIVQLDNARRHPHPRLATGIVSGH